MMNVKVKFFAIARDIVGSSEVMINLPVGSTASGILRALMDEHPKLEQWKSHLRMAVNWEYVTSEHVLHDDDEVAIIPPVSGG